MKFAPRGAIVMLCALQGVAFPQTCPSYTHKTDVITGQASALPDGWCVYVKNGARGIYRTPVRSFSETVIAGTENHTAFSLEISPDGEWILYVDTLSDNVYLVKSTGGSVTRVPVDYLVDPQTVLKYPQVGFRRNAPGSALEIWYPAFSWYNGPEDPGPDCPTRSTLVSLPVTLSGSGATFGSARKIADTEPTDYTGPYLFVFYTGTFCVWGDQIFGLCRIPPDSRTLNSFITIPNGGAGIAGPSNFYQFSEPPEDEYWGCGQTMSHDGLYCASNSRLVGTPECVPNQEGSPTYDHKGFYITKFLRAGVDPAIRIDDQIMDPAYGRSINWCPTEYRRGTYSEVEFQDWQFSNSNTYLVGISRGSRVATYNLSFGVWVVHWPTNTWTRITPQTTSVVYRDPALFFTGLNAVAPRPVGTSRSVRSGSGVLAVTGGAVRVPGDAARVRVYDPAGRVVWEHVVRAAGQDAATVLLPQTLRSGALVVVVE